MASIGAASFFSDAGHEIATAVLPSFLTGVLRGSAATVGLIEGLSDALLGLWGWPTPRPGWSWRSPPPSGSAIASRGS